MATYLFRLGRAAYIRRRLVLGIWIVLLVSSVARRRDALGTDLERVLHPGHRGAAGDRHAASASSRSWRHRAPPPASCSWRRAGTSLSDEANRAAVDGLVARALGGAQGRVRDGPVHDRRRQPGRHDRVRAGHVCGVPDRPGRRRPGGARSPPPRPRRAAGLTVEMGGDAFQRDPGAGRHRGHRHPDRRRGPVHHLRFARRGRAAAADRDPRHRHRRGPDHGRDRASSSSARTTPILALMIGLAVSIDYALFIVSRYRGELADYEGLAPGRGRRARRRHRGIGGRLRRA